MRHHAFFRLYVLTTHGLPWHVNEDMGALLFAKYKEMATLVTNICQRGKDESGFQTDAPYSLALAILGVSNAFLTSWAMGKKKKPLSSNLAEVRTHVRRLVRGEGQ